MTVRHEIDAITSFIESVANLDAQLSTGKAAVAAEPDAISRFLATVARLDAELRGVDESVA